jgi:sugar phosphate isomerase/epimerase
MAFPAHPPDRLPYGLCVYGLTYACGLAWAGTEKANPAPLTARQVIDLAAGWGLSMAELPIAMLGEEPEALRDLRAHADERQLGFVIAGGRVQAESLVRDLKVAAALGAPTVRCTLSGILCGDRRGFPGGWRNHLQTCTEALEAVLPEAERLQIAIAVENHQDADSEDLLALCRRFESPWLGVTLDCANPLAVLEEPVAFARKLAPYLRHAHIKDYTLHRAENGFRLVRAPLGDGVVPFPELLEILDAQERPITRSIELAALQARLIPWLERSWWDEYAPRDARDTLPALEFVWQRMRPDEEDWRTPFERDRPAEELAAYEWEQHRRSLEYLRRL